MSFGLYLDKSSGLKDICKFVVIFLLISSSIVTLTDHLEHLYYLYNKESTFEFSKTSLEYLGHIIFVDVVILIMKIFKASKNGQCL